MFTDSEWNLALEKAKLDGEWQDVLSDNEIRQRIEAHMGNNERPIIATLGNFLESLKRYVVESNQGVIPYNGALKASVINWLRMTEHALQEAEASKRNYLRRRNEAYGIEVPNQDM